MTVSALGSTTPPNTLISNALIRDFADYLITGIEVYIIADTDNQPDIYSYRNYCHF